MRYPIEIKGKTKKQVTKLNLSGHGLKEFPQNIYEYTNLTKLVLCNNQIKVIPKDILKLKHLKVLDLANNDISTLHSSIFRLPKLRTLNVYGNKIKKFPVQLLESNIRVLIAGMNRIEEFDFSVLRSLENIDLSNNQIRKLIMSEILPNLKVLRIKDNPLDIIDVPDDLSKSLKYCDVELLNKTGNRDNQFVEEPMIKEIYREVDTGSFPEESELIKTLYQATKVFVVEWERCDEYVYDGIFQGTAYRLWMDVKLYTETHEYFAYGLAVFHEKWKTIIYEEEDPDTTALSKQGEELSRLFELARNKKHSRVKESKKTFTSKPEYMDEQSKRVFIVHGHNELMKQHVARIVSELGLKPIILHEQANGGRTIIEKFLLNAEKTGFAIILLSADDLGISKKGKEESVNKGVDLNESLSCRARQNVVFEMGCFIGMIGRSRVFLLLEKGVEKPGDIDGVVYTIYDDGGAWRFDLVKELKDCGYEVSADSLL